MSKYIFIFCFLFAIGKNYAFQTDSIIKKLDQAISQKDIYIKNKHKQIALVKKIAEKNAYGGNRTGLYKAYLSLFEEYKSFQYDSAYFYIEQAKSLAHELKDSLKINETKINESFALMSSGLFKEANDTLNSINIETLPKSYKCDYYSVKARTYFDLADYTRDSRYSATYIKKGNAFLEKALNYVAPNSNEYWNLTGLKLLKASQWKAAEKALNFWINNYKLTPEYYAIATSSLAYVYDAQGFKQKNLDYLALASIADIENAIMETVALRHLANEFFKLGNLQKANRYISIAMEDANFYNARHRKIEISSILPIIEEAQLQKTEKQKSSLQKIVIALSILAIIVVIFSFIIFKQLRVRSASKRILAESNLKLQEVNTDLREADRIKQEYITYFLNASSDYIHRIDQLQKRILHKIITERPKEVVQILKKYNVKKARIDLFKEFDEVFLKLFPNFINDYYKLFPESEKVLLDKENSLNNELRIFALYRLGVQDSNQVANFLELSVATIYSYKARIKNRSKFKDTFEEKIMEIKQFDTKKISD
ncbi:DUF6377 domain-containing protein [Tamlana sp. I1]|uniref:DUF6377 domain-containing protein n=1 Tax=Tamlana sp. I1 TaxID=2762061 RepID=UPI00188EA850|nr:DUF6377 domain-containing protein [Tamlana sp. I1]